jgi:nitroimidazol reductase NimA-like FMN-containing flavoprotein (pyridoxamine 5'-phosphate oxidase superfamily)
VGFAIQGQPYVIPTAFGRDRDCIYIHGSSKSRMLQELKSGIPVCLTVTHLDGLVLARSSFHHSMNYRSAVVFGTASEVEGEEKLHGLFVISENILKGRWKEVREPNSKEMKVTTVVKIKIEEASAKVRSGPPGDDEKDYALSVWAGVIPVGIKTGPPVNDPLLRPGIDLSESVKALYVI